MWPSGNVYRGPAVVITLLKELRSLLPCDVTPVAFTTRRRCTSNERRPSPDPPYSQKLFAIAILRTLRMERHCYIDGLRGSLHSDRELPEQQQHTALPEACSFLYVHLSVLPFYSTINVNGTLCEIVPAGDGQCDLN